MDFSKREKMQKDIPTGKLRIMVGECLSATSRLTNCRCVTLKDCSTNEFYEMLEWAIPKYKQRKLRKDNG